MSSVSVMVTPRDWKNRPRKVDLLVVDLEDS